MIPYDIKPAQVIEVLGSLFDGIFASYCTHLVLKDYRTGSRAPGFEEFPVAAGIPPFETPYQSGLLDKSQTIFARCMGYQTIVLLSVDSSSGFVLNLTDRVWNEGKP